MSEQVWWYATRAAGLMTWATATASVVMGLMLSTKALRARTGPWFLDLHRFLGGISVVFLIAHMGTLWADSYVDFGPRELFVPGASEWRSEAIAWGIIAMYLMVAIEVSSLLRSRINNWVWRAIHFTSFAAMVAGSYHAYLAGSDVKNPITWAIAGIGSVLVMGLISMRLQRKDPDEQGSTRLKDQREILEEMRRRLEDLPIPESTPQPQISVVPNAFLPRRAPVSESLPGIDSDRTTDAADHDPIGFSADPFAAVPLPTAEPELGDWATPSAADPFNVATDAASPTAEAPDRAGHDLFDEVSEDPFRAMGVAPADTTRAFPDIPPAVEKPDLFAAAVESDPIAEFPSSPFEPVVPSEHVIESPPAGSTMPVGGPPPLPDAVDPATGEPDQAAYTQWLRDWLSYAERYGDEAPEDPLRV